MMFFYEYMSLFPRIALKYEVVVELAESIATSSWFGLFNKYAERYQQFSACLEERLPL